MVSLLPRICVGRANANVIPWCPHRRCCNLVGVYVSCGALQCCVSSLLTSSYWNVSVFVFVGCLWWCFWYVALLSWMPSVRWVEGGSSIMMWLVGVSLWCGHTVVCRWVCGGMMMVSEQRMVRSKLNEVAKRAYGYRRANMTTETCFRYRHCCCCCGNMSWAISILCLEGSVCAVVPVHLLHLSRPGVGVTLW